MNFILMLVWISLIGFPKNVLGKFADQLLKIKDF